MADTTLTPYDTGDRLEPHPWLRTAEQGRDPRTAEPQDFGRVDFDDEEGRTVATVYVTRTPDGYALHVVDTGEELVSIELPVATAGRTITVALGARRVEVSR